MHSCRGAPTRGARGPASPRDLKNTIFSGFLPLNYVTCIFEVCFLSLFLCGRTEEGCSMVNSLRQKLIFRTLLAIIHGKNSPPLRKSWVRPCAPAPTYPKSYIGSSAIFNNQHVMCRSIHTYNIILPQTSIPSFGIESMSRVGKPWSSLLSSAYAEQPVSRAVYAVPGVDGGVGLHGSAPPRSPGSLPAAPSGLGTGGERLTVSVGTATFTADDCCSAGIPTADRGGPRGGDSGHLPNTYQSLGANILWPPENQAGPLDSLGPLAEVDFLSGFRAPRGGSGLRGKRQSSAGRTRAPREGSRPRKTVQARGRNQGPSRQIRAHRTDQGPAMRIRATLDGSGPRGTDQSPKGRIRARRTNRVPAEQIMYPRH